MKVQKSGSGVGRQGAAREAARRDGRDDGGHEAGLPPGGDRRAARSAARAGASDRAAQGEDREGQTGETGVRERAEGLDGPRRREREPEGRRDTKAPWRAGESGQGAVLLDVHRHEAQPLAARQALRDAERDGPLRAGGAAESAPQGVELVDIQTTHFKLKALQRRRRRKKQTDRQTDKEGLYTTNFFHFSTYMLVGMFVVLLLML